MSLRRIGATEAIARLAEFDTLVDVRSESEFAEDHLPGAVNWPVLDDSQRERVGTDYRQASPFEARKLGAALVAANLARHIQQQVMTRPRDWRPLVYCWRGGQRSGAMALVLDQIGFRVHQIEGGYTDFRRAVRAELELLPATLRLRVLCGRTGTGKSRLLQALTAEGAQVLDLETLACHRGSVLGPLPGRAQPSQKAFETLLWLHLRGFDASRPVYAEGESRTIGRLRIPESLLERLRGADCIRLDMPAAARVQLLLQDYAHFVDDIDGFCARLEALRELRGAALVQSWQARARSGELPAVVLELLQQHYDPVYERSMPRNFAGYAAAPVLDLADAEPHTLRLHARKLIDEQA